MKRFRNILYVTDSVISDTRAFERTLELAIDNRAQLSILAVRESMKGVDDLESDLAQLLANAIDNELNESLETLAHIAHQRGIRVGTQSRLGEPFIEIIHTIIDGGHDLLVKTANPPKATMDWLLGGTDRHLLRKCPCPVWIDPIQPIPRYGRILAAIDPETDDEHGLNRTILELGTSMATRQDADLHVVHAWRLLGESIFTSGRAQISESRLNEMRAHQAELHEKLLNDTLATYRSRCRSITTHLVEGSVSDAILSTAREQQCDLLVMGTVGRIGIPGLFISNTAEEVLGDLPCAIMAIKPPGFRSPVEL